MALPVPLGVIVISPLAASNTVIVPELDPELVLRIKSPVPLVVIVALALESPILRVSMSTLKLPVPVLVTVMSALVVSAEIVVPAITRSPVPAADAAMVMVSVPALVVNVMPVPAASVRVSVLVSATTELCPATAMV